MPGFVDLPFYFDVCDVTIFEEINYRNDEILSFDFLIKKSKEI